MAFWNKKGSSTSHGHLSEAKTPALVKIRKYEMVNEMRRSGFVSVHGESVEGFRIRALIDIPLHGVKAGDLGGFVQDVSMLSHEGSCWVGGDAVASRPYESHLSLYGEVPSLPTIIKGDALVTGNASTCNYISDSVIIQDNAVVFAKVYGAVVIKDNVKVMDGMVYGNIVISDNVVLHQARITTHTGSSASICIGGDIIVDGNSESEFAIMAKDNEKISIKGKARFNKVRISGNFDFDAVVNLENVIFEGDNIISGTPKIQPDTKFTGRNVISGSSIIPASSHVHDVRMSDGVLKYGVPLPAISPVTANDALPLTAFVGDDITVYVDTIAQIEADYESYTTDIVKLIKYPGMVDTSIPEVGVFMVKLRSIKRAMKTASAEVLASLTDALELAFVNAENKVQTLVTSHLSDDSKKSLKTAEKMFALACNDASTEPEKRLGYKAGMRALEGVVVVSETAVEQMKARVGILELEA